MTLQPSACVFCGHPFPDGPVDQPSAGSRRAFDPWKGRLWNVCLSCSRWSPVPLAVRWETLEECERVTRNRGRVRLSSDNLSLIAVGEGELVRVGRPPRIEWAGWRYGDRMPAVRRGRGLLRRLLGSLPPPPLSGYRPYGLGYADPPMHWVMSPFQDASWGLTLAFTTVPLAPRCPSCTRPVALRPWSFHEIRLVEEGGTRRVLARCALCETEVTISVRHARPALRLGLSVVTPGTVPTDQAEAAASGVEGAGGSQGFARALAESGATLGDMTATERLGLAMALDEDAEVEALETEWREAEEVAAIMDGELTLVAGFEDFRRRILAESRKSDF
jgi:hypothetical protein